MKSLPINDPFHNPFYNRFNDPVQRRHDEMQAYAYMVWLKERNQLVHKTETSINSAHSPVIVSEQHAGVSDPSEPRHWGRLFGGVFALLLVVVVSVAFLSKAI